MFGFDDMALLLAGGSIASSVLGGVASVKKGNVERSIDQENARIADLNAVYARGAKIEAGRQIRYAAYQTKGAQLASYAHGGVVVDTGSPADVVAETQRQFELDLFKADLQGDLNIASYKQQAINLRRMGSASQQIGVLSAIQGVSGGVLQSLGALYKGSRAADSTSGSASPAYGADIWGVPEMNFSLQGRR